MSKKKREHIVFDLTRKPKKSIPFLEVNMNNGACDFKNKVCVPKVKKGI